MSDTREPDPFGPLEGIVTALLSLMVFGVLVFAVMGVVGLAQDGRAGVSIAEVGSDTCVPISNETPMPSATEVRQRGIDRSVATMRVEELDLCFKEPTVTQELLSVLSPAGTLVLGVGGLALARRVIHTGRRHGVFRPVFADRVRQLGWFLLVMTAAWPFVAALGSGVLVSQAVPGRSVWWGLFSPDISVGLVVVSLGVLSVARVLRRGIALQEEVDATV